MKYHLATLWRRVRNPKRREIILRPIPLPAVLATDLFNAGYGDAIAAWSGAIEDIIQAYERALAGLTRDSPEQITATISSVEAGLTAVMVSVRARLARWAGLIERLHRQKWRGAVLSATGVDLKTMIGPSDMQLALSAAIERNVGLISSVSEQTRTRIGERVFAGLQRRAPAREIASEIREVVEMSRKRARNIAADQTVKLASALNDERRREAGISTWEWVHSGKAHPREQHKARHGRRYDDSARSGAAKPPEDRPGQLPFCGCTSRAVLSLDDEF